MDKRVWQGLYVNHPGRQQQDRCHDLAVSFHGCLIMLKQTIAIVSLAGGLLNAPMCEAANYAKAFEQPYNCGGAGCVSRFVNYRGKKVIYAQISQASGFPVGAAVTL